ncbi:MAG: redoxin domain-containing protein [Gammaproteobacteria bacterium]|nr:redoxin domain-containing protein [Gammaproteobacteria bacterium]
MRRRCLGFVFVLAWSGSVWGASVDNFMLLDHRGEAHELHYHSDAAAVVLLVQGNGCPVVRNALPDLREVRERYAGEGVVFLMLNSNLQDTRESVRAEAEEWGIDLPILIDETQLVGEGLGLTRTAEALLIDPDGWELAYRGPINDRLSYERQLAEAKEHYLADAIDSLLAGTQPQVAQQDTVGCLINFPERDNPAHEQISYAETIVPILEQNCVGCHRPEGIGPWAMTSYEMVRGFAPMMREVLRTKRMPPWHADPHVGEWRDDAGISNGERTTLVHWIEAGAPRGEGEDPLPGIAVAPVSEWPLGEPDLVIELPAYDVPASGVVDYQFPTVANPLDHDVWVRAMDVLPGSTEVVHHVLVGLIDGDSNRRGGVFDDYLGGYAPGVRPVELPQGTGMLLPKDDHFLAQMHYTPYGKAVTDVTRIGFYLHDEKPNAFFRQGVVMNPTIAIPPNAKRHEQRAYLEFPADALLYDVLPHSHYRGHSSTFSLVYPDGREELLLNVPNYDFNWQRGYAFVEPRLVPAGSRLVHATVYDNSAQNLGNPDPSKLVRWGLQSWDEMLYGAFSFVWVGETTDRPIHDGRLIDAYQTIGYLDRDMDGRAEWDELPAPLKRRMAKDFEHGDADGDRALTAPELHASRQARQQAADGNDVAAAGGD